VPPRGTTLGGSAETAAAPSVDKTCTTGVTDIEAPAAAVPFRAILRRTFDEVDPERSVMVFSAPQNADTGLAAEATRERIDRSGSAWSRISNCPSWPHGLLRVTAVPRSIGRHSDTVRQVELEDELTLFDAASGTTLGLNRPAREIWSRTHSQTAPEDVPADLVPC
jgi:hypothetical protein